MEQRTSLDNSGTETSSHNALPTNKGQQQLMQTGFVRFGVGTNAVLNQMYSHNPRQSVAENVAVIAPSENSLRAFLDRFKSNIKQTAQNYLEFNQGSQNAPLAKSIVDNIHKQDDDFESLCAYIATIVKNNKATRWGSTDNTEQLIADLNALTQKFMTELPKLITPAAREEVTRHNALRTALSENRRLKDEVAELKVKLARYEAKNELALAAPNQIAQAVLKFMTSNQAGGGNNNNNAGLGGHHASHFAPPVSEGQKHLAELKQLELMTEDQLDFLELLSDRHKLESNKTEGRNNKLIKDLAAAAVRLCYVKGSFADHLTSKSINIGLPIPATLEGTGKEAKDTLPRTVNVIRDVFDNAALADFFQTAMDQQKIKKIEVVEDEDLGNSSKLTKSNNSEN